MKKTKNIMDSHEAYLEALSKDVTTYSMAELIQFRKTAQSSTAYLDYNIIYTKEIERRKKQQNGKAV